MSSSTLDHITGLSMRRNMGSMREGGSTAVQALCSTTAERTRVGDID